LDAGSIVALGLRGTLVGVLAIAILLLCAVAILLIAILLLRAITILLLRAITILLLRAITILLLGAITILLLGAVAILLLGAITILLLRAVTILLVAAWGRLLLLILRPVAIGLAIVWLRTIFVFIGLLLLLRSGRRFLLARLFFRRRLVFVLIPIVLTLHGKCGSAKKQRQRCGSDQQLHLFVPSRIAFYLDPSNSAGGMKKRTQGAGRAAAGIYKMRETRGKDAGSHSPRAGSNARLRNACGARSDGI
jgi:hypothetical protein